MSVLFITEFAACSTNERGGLSPVPLAPSVADQTVAIGATSTQSAALNAATNMVRSLTALAGFFTPEGK